METDEKTITEYLFALTYMTTTWFLFCRMDEVLSLKDGNLILQGIDHRYPGKPVDSIHLVFRKTNQYDV